MVKKSYEDLEKELKSLKGKLKEKKVKKEGLKAKVQRFFTPRGNEGEVLQNLMKL